MPLKRRSASKGLELIVQRKPVRSSTFGECSTVRFVDEDLGPALCVRIAGEEELLRNGERLVAVGDLVESDDDVYRTRVDEL